MEHEAPPKPDPNAATIPLVELVPSSPDGPELPTEGGQPGTSARSFRRVLFHIALGLGLIVSVTALAMAGFAVYALVEPGHLAERALVDGVLGPRVIGSAMPGASAASAAAHAPKPTPPKPSTSTALPEPSVPPPPAVARDAPGAPDDVPKPTPADRVPPANPWVSTPPELARLLPKATRSRGLDKREIVRVHEFNARHPGDPRGHLLLARSYVTRRWFKDAISEYQIALKMSDASRGDPRMLRDLLTMVELGSAEAGKLVVHTFGETAVSAIDHALAGRQPNPGAKELLEKLRREAVSSGEGAPEPTR